MKPRMSDATGWEVFEDCGHDVLIYYPVGIANGIEPEAERRFSYVPAAVALRGWYKVEAPDCRAATFYGERALANARHHADKLLVEKGVLTIRGGW